jgi:hypothetical protein
MMRGGQTEGLICRVTETVKFADILCASSGAKNKNEVVGDRNTRKRRGKKRRLTKQSKRSYSQLRSGELATRTFMGER